VGQKANELFQLRFNGFWAISGLARPAVAGQALVAHKSPALLVMTGGRLVKHARLLPVAGGRSFDPTAVRRHALEGLGTPGTRRIAGNCRPRTSRQATGARAEGCREMPPGPEVPVGSTSPQA